MRRRAARAAILGIALSGSAIGTEDYVFVASIRCLGGPYGLSLPKDAQQFPALGSLLREEISEVEQWDGYTATRKTLFFDGLTLGVVSLSNAPQQVMLTQVVVSSAAWNHLIPFTLSQPVEAARALLGEHAKDDITLTRTYGSEGDSIEFKARSGVLSRVSYSCYSG